jgi:hypothetical protein
MKKGMIIMTKFNINFFNTLRKSQNEYSFGTKIIVTEVRTVNFTRRLFSPQKLIVNGRPNISISPFKK